MTPPLFSELIGQRALTDEIGFYIQNYRATKVFPNCLLIAERGAGKNTVALEIGRALRKPFHEILAKDLEDSDALFQHVVIPLLDGKSATVFVDEASLLSENLTHTLLSVLNPTKTNKTFYTWKKNNQRYEFDFTKLTFLFATTNPQKIDPDLKDRLKPFTFEQYSVEDLAEILVRNTPGVRFEDGVLPELAATLRNNPRNATMRAQDILGYLKTKNRKKIERADFEFLRRKLHIMPLGLNKMEMQALEFIQERPLTSLTTLAAKMHMTAAAVQREVETRLLATNLIDIHARGRAITSKGRELLVEATKISKNKLHRK